VHAWWAALVGALAVIYAVIWPSTTPGWLRRRDRSPPMSDLAADCGRGVIQEARRSLQPVGGIEVGTISAAGGDATRSVIFWRGGGAGG
jgi:hypothetical protein